MQVLQLQKVGICRKFPDRRSITVVTDLISASWKVNLMLALNHSLLNREETLIDVLKALALIISTYSLHHTGL
jgi:hypothetical protein